MADDFVYVRLKGDSTTPPGRVTRVAYDEIWAEKGWVVVDDDEAAAATSPEPAPEPEPTTTSSRKKGA